MNIFQTILTNRYQKQQPQPQAISGGGQPLNTLTMTQEQLTIRRMQLIEGAKFGRPFHENLMLIALKVWLVLGPIAFVALTTSEVAYIFATLLPPGDSGDKIILFGALFVDLAMMFTTFGVAIKRRDLADKKEANGKVPGSDVAEVWFGTLLWLIFATINIIGQAAFLLHIVQSSAHPGNLNLIYLFISARVVGFILGDATTAFFLAKVDTGKLKLIAKAEREKAKLNTDLAEAEGERRMANARTEAEMERIQIEVQQRREEAAFLAALRQNAFTAALGGTPSNDGPTRSRVYRGNS